MFKAFDEIVVRTPLLPLKYLSQEIDSVLSSVSFRTAISLSSPIFEQSLSDDSLDSKKIRRTLRKYLYRACARCTPFGLFSGFSMGKITEETRIMVSKPSEWISHVGIDSQAFYALFAIISQSPEIRNRLKFYPNPSLYVIYDRYHYSKRVIDENSLRHVSIDLNEYVETIIKTTKHGAYIDEIVGSIQQVNPELSKKEAILFISKLIDMQVIISAIEPSPLNMGLIGTFRGLLPFLEERSLKGDLALLCDTIDLIDGENPETILAKTKEASCLISSIAPNSSICNLKIDMEKPAFVSISKKDVEEIRHSLLLMSKIVRQEENPEMTKFADVFEKRYNGSTVPFLEALDKIYGIGYPVGESDVDYNVPLLSGVIFPIGKDQGTFLKYNDVDIIVLNKYSRCLSERENTITLTDDDFAGIDYKAKFAKTISVLCTFLKDGRIYIRAAGGTSAINLLNRFSQQSPRIGEIVKKIAKCEDDMDTDGNTINVDVFFVPNGSDGNLVVQSCNRNTIPFMSGYPETPQNGLTISDIMMSIRNDRLVLSDSTGDYIVHPHLSNSYNYRRTLHPVIRFLDDYQQYDIADNLLWRWNSLMLDADYLPRVQYGRCILSRCRWRIKTSLFKKTTAADFPPTFTTFRKKRNIPNTCFLIDFDSELYLDFTREDDLDILRRYIDKREYVVIEENLYDADNSIVVGPDGVYANEVILSFVVA